MNQSIKGITGVTMEFFSADEIPALFDRTGWTQAELASYIGVSVNTVGSWLKGKKKKSMKQKHREKFIELRKQVAASPERS